jgi:hypothetical protein
VSLQKTVLALLPHLFSGYVHDFHAIVGVFCFVIFVLLIFQRFLIVVFRGSGESEGTLGLPFDMTTTISGIATNIYGYLFILNCWHFTFSVNRVAKFVVTLEKVQSTAVCTKEV